MEDIANTGPARVLLGSHGGVQGAVNAPSPMNVLAVRLTAGERWTYQPPPGHTVLWTSPVEGDLLANHERLRAEELVAFEHADQSVAFEALTDNQYLLGSAVPHGHPLSLGYYSVHTSPAALRAGEAHIQAVGRRLVSEGRLQPWQL
jgi:redox-sensitive bicupin YhaK (pirin superfamily)